MILPSNARLLDSGLKGVNDLDKARIYDEAWTRMTGHSRIWGAARDPHTIFVYWELDELRKDLLARHFQLTFDALPLYLCVYDVTGRQFDGWNAPLATSSKIPNDAESWYLNNLSPGRDYVVDLATTTIDNQFFSILRANIVRLPNPHSSSNELLATFRSLPPVLYLDTEQTNHVTPTRTCSEDPTASQSQMPYQDVFDGYHVVEREGLK